MNDQNKKKDQNRVNKITVSIGFESTNVVSVNKTLRFSVTKVSHKIERNWIFCIETVTKRKRV